jgi:hypothetical protein
VIYRNRRSQLCSGPSTIAELTGIDVRGYRRHCVTAQESWWESSTVAPL